MNRRSFFHRLALAMAAVSFPVAGFSQAVTAESFAIVRAFYQFDFGERISPALLFNTRERVDILIQLHTHARSVLGPGTKYTISAIATDFGRGYKIGWSLGGTPGIKHVQEGKFLPSPFLNSNGYYIYGVYITGD